MLRHRGARPTRSHPRAHRDPRLLMTSTKPPIRTPSRSPAPADRYTPSCTRDPTVASASHASTPPAPRIHPLRVASLSIEPLASPAPPIESPGTGRLARGFVQPDPMRTAAGKPRASPHAQLGRATHRTLLILGPPENPTSLAHAHALLPRRSTLCSTARRSARRSQGGEDARARACAGIVGIHGPEQRELRRRPD
jgi:hypothetical protein